jgi:two-component system, response regulator, stage 0 sporulation protein F
MMTELEAPSRHLFGKNPGVSTTTPTILVIDDEEGIRALLRMILEGAGYKVLEAANGREGIDLYRRSLSDVIITDIDMPELNGLDMILALTHEFLDAKVIAMSGVGGEDNALDMAKLLGARRIMQKPFSMPTLLDAVQYELDH